MSEYNSDYNSGSTEPTTEYATTSDTTSALEVREVAPPVALTERTEPVREAEDDTPTITVRSDGTATYRLISAIVVPITDRKQEHQETSQGTEENNAASSDEAETSEPADTESSDNDNDQEDEQAPYERVYREAQKSPGESPKAAPDDSEFVPPPPRLARREREVVRVVANEVEVASKPTKETPTPVAEVNQPAEPVPAAAQAAAEMMTATATSEDVASAKEDTAKEVTAQKEGTTGEETKEAGKPGEPTEVPVAAAEYVDPEPMLGGRKDATVDDKAAPKETTQPGGDRRTGRADHGPVVEGDVYRPGEGPDKEQERAEKAAKAAADATDKAARDASEKIAAAVNETIRAQNAGNTGNKAGKETPSQAPGESPEQVTPPSAPRKPRITLRGTDYYFDHYRDNSPGQRMKDGVPRLILQGAQSLFLGSLSKATASFLGVKVTNVTPSGGKYIVTVQKGNKIHHIPIEAASAQAAKLRAIVKAAWKSSGKTK